MTQEEKELLLKETYYDGYREAKKCVIKKAVEWLVENTETVHYADGSEKRCLRKPFEESIEWFKTCM